MLVRVRDLRGVCGNLTTFAAVDCVYIPLPTALRAEWGVKAAKAGWRILFCLCYMVVTPQRQASTFFATNLARAGLLHFYLFSIILRIMMFCSTPWLNQLF